MSNYSVWPEQSDVQVLLDSLGVSPTLTGSELTERVQQISDQVTGEVGRFTSRQFVADSEDSVRIYDGTGTAELEIDEFISFTGAVAAGLQADPGYGLDNVVAVMEQNKPMTRLVRGVGSLPAFSVASVYQPVPTIFPAGRQNILVTATFGYGTSVPKDLWQAVCGEIARRLVAETVFGTSLGRVELKEGDIATEWAPSSTPGIDLAAQYKAMVKLYTRPTGRRLRNLRSRMI
jgi:hypothetical protein